MRLLSLSILLLLDSSLGARILAVFPIYIKSHSIFTHPIAKELARRGHDVTIITPFEDPDKLPNYKEILSAKETLWHMGI
jgi:glucuronosyltransferase